MKNLILKRIKGREIKQAKKNGKIRLPGIPEEDN